MYLLAYSTSNKLYFRSFHGPHIEKGIAGTFMRLPTAVKARPELPDTQYSTYIKRANLTCNVCIELVVDLRRINYWHLKPREALDFNY